MDELLTIIVAIAPYHIEIAERALASIRAQTFPVRALYEVDAEATGPAVIRNRLLAQVDTPFVAFLDADDWLEPEWASRTLAVYEPGHYVYTDHWQDETRHSAGERAFLTYDQSHESYTWHPITTLLPTEVAREIRFDETLPGGEDTAFYLQLMARGICGKWLAEPLFHYGIGGKRGRAFYHNPDRISLLTGIWQEYGGKAMACCGDKMITDQPPAGVQQPGDILAQTLWMGNRQERGMMTGRLYPRTGNGKTLWVNASDVQARPDLFRPVTPPAPVSTPASVPPAVLLEQARRKAQEAQKAVAPAHGVAEVAAKIYGQGLPTEEPVLTVDDLMAVEPASVKPDARKVQKLAKRARAKK